MAMKKTQTNKRKPMSEETKKKISWTMERRNKYSDNDSTKRPAPGVRQKYWVRAYTRSDGNYIKGHYQMNPHYDPEKARAALKIKR